jgi:hypothetical protein
LNKFSTENCIIFVQFGPNLASLLKNDAGTAPLKVLFGTKQRQHQYIKKKHI